MNFINCIRVLQLQIKLQTPVHYAMQVSGYAAVGFSKKAGKKSQVVEKKKMEVETDIDKLLTYCCGSNIYVEGEDVKLKPDSEYPDWLWTLNTGPPPPIEQLDPNTKEYWRRIRKLGLERNAKLAKYRRR